MFRSMSVFGIRDLEEFKGALKALQSWASCPHDTWTQQQTNLHNQCLTSLQDQQGPFTENFQLK